ncbi:MAG TPA: HAMP domain-containing histidine kinase [Candidatus Agathobaculum stercoravium]|nr:HAMP domain-containing histidine kinase [Candidatus Agathobaculum stercoravium]
MKTKRRNYWNFFWRVGAGFLAFWLAVMAGFTLLLGWQTAQEMRTVMMENLKYFYNDWLQGQLQWYEVGQLSGDLEGSMDHPFANDKYLDYYVGSTITETAVLSADNEILQDDTGWLRAIEEDWQERIDAGEEVPTYEVVMAGQPKRVYEAIMQWNNDDLWEANIFGSVTVDGWLVDNKIYPKTIRVEYRGYNEDGTRKDVQPENKTVECDYDAQQFAGVELQTFQVNQAVMPGNMDTSFAEQLDSLSNPRRLALHEWVTTPQQGTGGYQESVKPWLVTMYRHRVVQTAAAPEGYLVAQYASEGYPIKECLPILKPVYGFSFALAVLFSAILAFALLRVWRKQERVEQARRDTTAALAHELKTPLSVLSATAELLSNDMAQDKRAHYLEVIRQQAARMDGSVRQMLELSRLEAGAKALRREQFTLSTLAQERLDAAIPPDTNLHTEVTVSGTDEVDADRALLARALDAILENAVQHTAPGGSIFVRMENGVCAVVNTGAPIPADALPRLWEAYYQADASRAAEGNGLGLSIAKTVFDLHGFAYGAENTDEGPRFWFRFG